MQESKVDVRPYTLVAELTYRCPLRCPYCANPTNYKDHSRELSTEVPVELDNGLDHPLHHRVTS